MAEEKIIYALNLADDCRILSATYDCYAPADWPRVDYLPKGDITDYKYINGEYMYRPLPKEEDKTEQAKSIDELVEEKVEAKLRELAEKKEL